MVSSRERLLAAAAREFAARGYDGAGVDAIAKAARINKAMIYYHFKSKEGLYRAVLQDVFAELVRAVGGVAETDAPADVKVRRYVRIIADVITSRPQFPALWIEEFVSGVPHLDQETLTIARRVVVVLARILEEGRRQEVFRAASPLEIHISIIAPLLLFAASGRTRQRLARAGVPEARTLTLDRMVDHITESTLAILCRTEGNSHA